MITVEQLRDNYIKNQLEFRVIVPLADLVSIELDSLDRAMLDEPPKTSADVLLDLHTLAFRQIQQAERDLKKAGEKADKASYKEKSPIKKHLFDPLQSK